MKTYITTKNTGRAYAACLAEWDHETEKARVRQESQGPALGTVSDILADRYGLTGKSVRTFMRVQRRRPDLALLIISGHLSVIGAWRICSAEG